MISFTKVVFPLGACGLLEALDSFRETQLFGHPSGWSLIPRLLLWSFLRGSISLCSTLLEPVAFFYASPPKYFPLVRFGQLWHVRLPEFTSLDPFPATLSRRYSPLSLTDPFLFSPSALLPEDPVFTFSAKLLGYVE